MNVRAQFFAQLRDLAGVSDVDVDLPEHSTVADLLDKIYAAKPDLRKQDATMLFGVGVEFVDRNYQLQPNDVIAIMPPVQGG
jgi:molybdopterin converting factor small subunit